MESKTKTQCLFLKGQSRITVVILIGLAAILLLVMYSTLKKSAQKPTAALTLPAAVENQAASQKSSAAEIIKVGAGGKHKNTETNIASIDTGEKSGFSEEGRLSSSSTAASPGEKPREKLKSEGSYLATDLGNVPLTIEEGGRIKNTFKLANNGAKPISIAIYKSEFGLTKSEAEAELEKLLYYKNNPQTINKGSHEVLQTSVFFGAPELMLFPQYADLAPGEEKEIALTINAKQLDSDKDYTGYLYAVGTNKEDSLIIPINILPQPAPKISLANIAVDDGLSADTQGNTDNVANPNETVAVTVTLENKGNAPAQELSVGVSSSDTTASILGGGAINIPSIEPHSQVPVRILMKISADAHPVFPPTLYLVITDSQGRKWQENFYVGEEGKFQYPTGLKTENTSNE